MILTLRSAIWDFQTACLLMLNADPTVGCLAVVMALSTPLSESSVTLVLATLMARTSAALTARTLTVVTVLWTKVKPVTKEPKIVILIPTPVVSTAKLLFVVMVLSILTTMNSVTKDSTTVIQEPMLAAQLVFVTVVVMESRILMRNVTMAPTITIIYRALVALRVNALVAVMKSSTLVRFATLVFITPTHLTRPVGTIASFLVVETPSSILSLNNVITVSPIATNPTPDVVPIANLIVVVMALSIRRCTKSVTKALTTAGMLVPHAAPTACVLCVVTVQLTLVRSVTMAP